MTNSRYSNTPIYDGSKKQATCSENVIIIYNILSMYSANFFMKSLSQLRLNLYAYIKINTLDYVSRSIQVRLER